MGFHRTDPNSPCLSNSANISQSLQDFKATSFFEYLAYGYLYISLLISVSVYGVDTFTAYNLIALDRFNGFEPSIPLIVAKWIFVGCIIASWVNVIYEHIRAWRTMARGAVAESYLDSLAVRLQCIRIFGKNGMGWRRFLVFSELTKSKKGAEYVALFTYFSFQAWIRVLVCSGPRQVVNAITMVGVYQENLNPGDPDPATSILRFFENFKKLMDKDTNQAVMLCGMLFTLVIWVFALLSLLLAVCFYILFLWHYIPNGDGGLSGYCQRKIEGRLTKIVSVKVNAAIQEEERKMRKAHDKAEKKGEKPILGRQATLPQLFDQKEDKLPAMPMLHHSDSVATLPQYSSRAGTPANGPRVPDMELSNLEKRPVPSRLGTAASNKSYASNAGLMAGAADMGYGRAGSPVPSLPGKDDDDNGYPFPKRTMTGNTATTNWSQPSRNGTPVLPGGSGPQRNLTPMDRSMNMTPMERTESPMTYGGYSANPVDRTRNMTPMERTTTPGSYNPKAPYPSRSDTFVSTNSYGATEIMKQYPNPAMTSNYAPSPIDQPTVPSFEPTLPNFGDDDHASAFGISNVRGGPRAPSAASNHRGNPSQGSIASNSNAQRPGYGRSTPSQSSTTYDPYGRASPAPSNGPASHRGPAGRFPVNPGPRSASAAPQQGIGYPHSRPPPARNMTAPIPEQNSYYSSDAPPRIATPAGMGGFNVGGGQNGLFSNPDADVERGYGQQSGGSGFKF